MARQITCPQCGYTRPYSPKIALRGKHRHWCDACKRKDGWVPTSERWNSRDADLLGPEEPELKPTPCAGGCGRLTYNYKCEECWARERNLGKEEPYNYLDFAGQTSQGVHA
jgi:hypothetical protein